jgi:hypothetical protein
VLNPTISKHVLEDLVHNYQAELAVRCKSLGWFEISNNTKVSGDEPITGHG